MAFSIGLRRPLNKPYTHKHIPNGIKTEVKPLANIAAKHSKVDTSSINALDGVSLVIKGTHNWASIPVIPKTAKKIPVWAGVIFKISTLNV